MNANWFTAVLLTILREDLRLSEERRDQLFNRMVDDPDFRTSENCQRLSKMSADIRNKQYEIEFVYRTAELPPFSRDEDGTRNTCTDSHMLN